MKRYRLSGVTERLDSKQAEKTYLSRTGGSAWEREKPFSPPGDDTFDESVDLLHDFTVAVKLLQPSPGDRIVDLGAGGGWCSDLLQRLNRNAVAVDISVEMLQVSRKRPTRVPIKAVAGDLEHLPFADRSFDKAICVSALHHVPDMVIAVTEISRILTDTGVAVFSEPGAGHSSMPGSVAATQDFGVLEQEVLIEPFIEMCQAAGFARVHVCPIAYVIPEFELSLEEWRAWRRLSRMKRPFRAADKMLRALLEFEASPEETVTATVTVTNAGGATWPAGAGTGQVRLGIQLLDARSRVTDRDFARVDLTADVPAGESRTIRAVFRAPVQPGDYRLKFDLVAEGVTWFGPTGTIAEVRPFRIVRR